MNGVVKKKIILFLFLFFYFSPFLAILVFDWVQTDGKEKEKKRKARFAVSLLSLAWKEVADIRNYPQFVRSFR